MITFLDCVPCLIKQAIETLRFLPMDDSSREKILREVMRNIAAADLTNPPPVIAQGMHRCLRKLSGVNDPYHELKERFNSMALTMIDSLNDAVKKSKEPMIDSLKLAIAGNVIDCGAKTGLSESDVRGQIENACSENLEGDVLLFLEKASIAKNILYLADNAGEIVFDRLLIERLGKERITLAVRGFPIINDAVMSDARRAGLDKMVRVISNGNDAPGTILKECSEEFQKSFNEADLIISKGQGNYETLCCSEKEIFFLLKVKCQIIADHTGLKLGTHAVIHSPSHFEIQNISTSHK